MRSGTGTALANQMISSYEGVALRGAACFAAAAAGAAARGL